MEEVHAREGLVLTVKFADVLSSNGNIEAHGDRWWRNRLFPELRVGCPWHWWKVTHSGRLEWTMVALEGLCWH